jgi:RNA polymerase sigma-70 factor (ECF subfamily)
MTSSIAAVVPPAASLRDARYREARDAYGPALARLARGYEREADARRDLLQDIHVALWQSFATFDGRCSLRTWVYRVAHNVACAHMVARRRARASELVDLDALDEVADERDVAADADRNRALERLFDLIGRLKPLDRQLMLLYLEGVEAGEIGEIVGLSATNVATRVHRVKRVLKRAFDIGGSA